MREGLIWLLLILGLLGCSEQPSLQWGEQSAEELGEGRFALLMAEMPADRGAQLSAFFVEYRGPSAFWARKALGIWSPPESEEFHCELLPNQTGSALESTREISLLDAGELTVASDSVIRLDVHAMPSLQYLGGVFYEREVSQQQSWQFKEEAYLTFSATGSLQVPPLAVDLVRPEPITLTAIGHHAPRESQDIRALEALDLSWYPVDKLWVSVEFYDDTLSTTPIAACSLPDGGTATLPAEFLSKLVQEEGPRSLRLVLRRSERVELSLSGFDYTDIIASSTDQAFINLY